MKRPFHSATTALTLFSLLAGCGKDAAPAAPAPAPRTAAPVVSAAEPAPAFVSSIDAASGRPTFLWATAAPAAPKGSSVEEAARFHLGRMAHTYGLAPEVARATELDFVHDVGRGAKIVALRQRVNGLEIYPGAVKIVMKPSLELVAISGTLRAGQAPKGGFRLSAADALAGALSTHFATRVDGTDIAARGRAEGGYERLALATAPSARGGVLRLDQPARVKPIYFPVGDALAPAYFVEFFASTEKSTTSEAYRYIVAAADGKVLERSNLTADAAFNYRVWAETTGLRRPLDGPLADFTPHPTGTPDGINPGPVANNLVTMDGFNTNREGTFDAWLPAGATQTLGNNVDAYSDVNTPDGFSNGDLRAFTSAAGVFDRLYNLTLGPVSSPDQQMAAITNLFYVTNWLHDYWYDSGFDEAAGNGQQANFGRGGLGGDVLHVEAEDGSGRNNANMSTPADGSSPRMQMFVWNGPEPRTLTLQPGNLSLQNNGAGFGPSAFNLTGDVVLVDTRADASVPMPDSLACTPVLNNVAGKIALIDRGTCTFVVKVKNAQLAGATGVIMVNNVAGGFPGLGGVDATITIGALGITLADGNALKTALQSGTVSATLFRQPGVDLDGDLDNTVVAHEWGHYLHHRLAVCNSSQQCGAMSEGWADFTAMQMLLREGDNLDGTYGMGQYATMTGPNFSYNGIRRFPYSVNMAKNGLTFKHISNGVALPDGSPGPNNSEVHNGGEIWCETMFEAYVALQRQTLGPTATRTFTQVQRRMADYVVAGLELTPANATYTEQRDGILAAIAASDASDLATVSAAFARRGMGSCAVSPPRTSTTFVGTVESFEQKSLLAIASVKLDDGAAPCDTDGALDVGETGRITVQVLNGSAAASSGADISIGNASAGLVFPGGATVHVPAIPAFGSASVTFAVGLEASVTGIQDIHFDVTASDANACQTTVTFNARSRGNTDVALAASASDDVEPDVSSWSEADGHAFTRQADDSFHHHWNGADREVPGAVALVSPVLQVSTSQPLVITFKHRFAFETDLITTPATPVFYDGGVIEVSSDDGATWQDIATLIAPGYGGALAAGSGNPLATRQAFVNKNAANPAYDTVTLDLGAQLAGHAVRLRFRVASDSSVGAAGWDIDDLAVTGIDNTPFNVLVADLPSVCPSPPQALAGDDQTVASGALVALDASGSSDVNGDPLTFVWTQTAGPAVTIVDAASAAALFHAPVVATPTTLTFKVTVSDGTSSANDSVDVTVLAPPPPPPPDAGVPDASPPDAALPDATPPPPPDAALPDATPPPPPDATLPDATPVPPPDATPTPTPDATPTPRPDAGHGTGGGDDGCGCEVGGRSQHRGALGGGLLTALGLGLLVPMTRRKRRSDR